jgi:hypothetical protein
MATEEFKVAGDDVVKVFKQLIAAGNARKIIIKREDGSTFAEFPVTMGAVGALVAPTLAAVGAIAALVTKCTIVVEKRDDSKPATEPPSTGSGTMSASVE